MPSPTSAYRALPADERQEFRLPGLLKEHLSRAAARTGQTIAEYITAALAERVTRDLAETTEWTLTAPEQEALLRTLAAASKPSAQATKLAARADALFGPLPPKKKKR
ncbi:MAG TPA: hypothetical protein VNW46_10910 [Gemmatimonadaceae bacterium]|jgi:hypothetical protein|nr:hypothetical protein [Gemmatimonadaceae bacterium]